MARGNPNIRNIPHRGRRPLDSEPFYFIINNEVRVTKDPYQYIINKRSVAKNTGLAYEIGVRFYSSLNTLIKEGLNEFGISESDRQVFLNKVVGVTQIYKNGKMVVSLPKDIIFDKRDMCKPKQ